MDSPHSSLKSRILEFTCRPRVRVAMLLINIAFFTFFLVYQCAGLRKNLSERAGKAAVEARIPHIRAAMAKEGDFVGVTLHASGWSGGSLLVAGIVESEADLAALKKAVSASGVPVPVKYQVSVLSPMLKKKLENAP